MPSLKQIDGGYLMKKILDRSSDTLNITPDYQVHKNRLVDLLERCINYGESNSVIVVGPRGCGKTTLVENCLDTLSNSESSSGYVVRLNGLLQTDDNMALEEMTRQLNLDNVTDGVVFGSMEERLQFLLQSLKSGSRNSQPVVVVIDECDLFSYHRNQTLLYNLFDISQSRQTPLCIIGVTSRLDVVELLEKRVKSRFSHRFIHMLARPLPSSLCQLFLSYLKLPAAHKQSKASYAARWNAEIERLAEDGTVKDALLFQFSVSSDFHGVKNLACMAAAHLSSRIEASQLPQQRDLLEALKATTLDSKAALLQGVSVLDLCLIISMKQLSEMYADEPFNFQMVYDHYKKFSTTKSSMKVFPKAIAMKAFEHLIELEIAKPIDQSSSSLKEYCPMRLLVTSKEIEDAVLHYTGCPSDVKHWANSDWIQ